VCLATTESICIPLPNGFYVAMLDGQPALDITGHHFHDLIDTYAQQDVDLDRVLMDVAVYNTRVMGPHHVEKITHLACRSALSRRGVAHITFPTDFQGMSLRKGVSSERNVHPEKYTAVYATQAGVPSDDDLKRAAEVLNEGEKVAILAGR